MVSRIPGGFDHSRSLRDELLREIRAKVPIQQFETWFRNLPLAFIAPNRLVITAGNRFSRMWIDRKFRDVLMLSARSILGVEPAIEIVSAEPEIPCPGIRTPPSGEGDGFDATRKPFLPPSEGPRVLEATTSEASSAPGDPGFSSPINRDYTFSNFVVGASNRLAHAAVLGGAESPGISYNPIYVYGGVGLGKTHLLHAIVHRMRETGGFTVMYLTSESFINSLCGNVEQSDQSRFRGTLRAADLLIIDDIQFISSREKAQEEFFHTFNVLISERKQVVLSSDCPPKEIPGLKERLVSRFQMGLIAKVDPPDFETRVRIILRKARARGREIPESVAEFIAEHIATNIRELEGAITRMISLSCIHEGQSGSVPITEDLARKALKDVQEEQGAESKVGISEIQKAVSAFYDVKLGDLLSKQRSQTVSLARQVSMTLCRRLTHHSLDEIGTIHGGRDHSTVIYAIGRIQELSRSDSRLRHAVQEITHRICSHHHLL